MPSRIPLSARAKALQLANCGLSYKKIRTILAKDGHLHSVNGIRRLVKRIRDSGYFKNKARSGRRSLLKDRHLELKEEQLQDDDESTSADLLQVIKTESGDSVSQRTIRRARRKLGWVRTGAKYCQLIRLENQTRKTYLSESD